MSAIRLFVFDLTMRHNVIVMCVYVCLVCVYSLCIIIPLLSECDCVLAMFRKENRNTSTDTWHFFPLFVQIICVRVKLQLGLLVERETWKSHCVGE